MVHFSTSVHRARIYAYRCQKCTRTYGPCVRVVRIGLYSAVWLTSALCTAGCIQLMQAATVDNKGRGCLPLGPGAPLP